MPLRGRVALVAAVAVAIAILIAAVVSYVVVRNELRGQVDDALKAQAVAVQRGEVHALGQQLPGIPPSAGGPAQYFQIVGPSGTALVSNIALPIDSQARSVAGGNGGAYMTDVQEGANHLRVLTFPVTVFAGDQPHPVVLLVHEAREQQQDEEDGVRVGVHVHHAVEQADPAAEQEHARDHRHPPAVPVQVRLNVAPVAGP